MLDKNEKNKIIEKFRTHPTDTGSSQVQTAILSREIELLTEHLKSHKKDFSSRRGLLKKVSERFKLLRYLSRTDEPGYEDLSKKLKVHLPKDVFVRGGSVLRRKMEQKS